LTISASTRPQRGLACVDHSRFGEGARRPWLQEVGA
jgi:hypothetical protein